jgi:hypothetical protein
MILIILSGHLFNYNIKKEFTKKQHRYICHMKKIINLYKDI